MLFLSPELSLLPPLEVTHLLPLGILVGLLSFQTGLG